MINNCLIQYHIYLHEIVRFFLFVWLDQLNHVIKAPKLIFVSLAIINEIVFCGNIVRQNEHIVDLSTAQNEPVTRNPRKNALSWHLVVDGEVHNFLDYEDVDIDRIYNVCFFC